MDFCEIRIFPGEELDYLDTGKEFLEEFSTLVGEYHSPLAETKQDAHQPGLYGYDDEEDGETGESTGTQVDQKDDQTDDQLDRSGPGAVEEIASEVDTRNVSGDVVDQFSVGVNMSSASRESKGLVVDGGDQPCTQQDTGTQGAVERVVHSERQLHRVSRAER